MTDTLGNACKQLASATHCLREWPEPSDDVADRDDDLRRHRRSDMSWR